MQIMVKKLDGQLEAFEAEKLINSLQNAGASHDTAAKITNHIEKELYNGISTQEIYAHAFEILKHFEKKPVAALYSLKRALFDLGPSGFPFEQFIGEVFKELKYKNVKSDLYMQGVCAPHEIDFYAEKEGRTIGAELKFHNSLGIKTDLKVALYVRERFRDLKNAKHKIDEGWLITNTGFTKNVIKYAKCSGLRLLGWDYPHDKNLLNIIEESKVHPITALTTLSSLHKKTLLEKDVVTCKQALSLLLNTEKNLLKIDNLQEVIEELKLLCGR